MLEAVFASFGIAVIVVAVIHVVTGALFGLALATWTGFPAWLGILLGVVTPVVGPVTAAIVVTARRSPGEAAVARPRRLRLNGIALAIPAVAMLATLFLPWWITRFEGVRIPLMPTGNFLDTVIIVSLIIVAAVGVLVGTLGMVHLGAALLTAVIAFWAFLLFALGAATKALQETLVGVSGLSVTLGDLVRFFGLSPSDLPLDRLGLDPEQLDLTDIAGSASVEFGSGWYVMIGALVVALAWTIWAAVVPARRGDADAVASGSVAGAGVPAAGVPGGAVPGAGVSGAGVRVPAPAPVPVAPGALAASSASGSAAVPPASPWGQGPSASPWGQSPGSWPQSTPGVQSPQSPGAFDAPSAAPATSPWDEIPPTNPWSPS